MLGALNEVEDELAALQALRASPPGLAQRPGRRRKVFSAALQQLGELVRASEKVGLATAPLTLFYALSQGGRAVASARVSGPGDRYAFFRHGARVVHGETLGSTCVKREPRSDARDALSVLADACGSTIPSAARVAELWASLPLLTSAQDLGDGLAPPLEVTLLANNPAHHHYGLGAVVLADPPPCDPNVEWAGEQIAAYPAAAGAHLGLMTSVPQGLQVQIEWLNEDRSRRMPADVCEPFLDEVYLRPRLGSDDVPPDVFLTWWLLLLALSSEARYRPAQWTAAIDLDTSAAAVPLELGLRFAVRVIPRLVRAALTAHAGT